jgi:hypothetical protein
MNKSNKFYSKFVNYDNLDLISNNIELGKFNCYNSLIPISSFTTIITTSAIGYYIDNSFVFFLLFINILLTASIIYFNKDFITIDKKYHIFYNKKISTIYFLYHIFNSIIFSYLPLIDCINRYYCLYAFLSFFALSIFLFGPSVFMPIFLHDPKKRRKNDINGSNNL